MTYATQPDLVERYGERMLIDLSDRATPPANAIDAGVITRALEDTDAAINGYLANRYKLPLEATPALLRDVALAIAVYKLHRDAASEKIRQDYVDALKQLALISSGTVRLDVAGVEPATSGSNGVQASDRPRDMTPDNLKGFI